MFSMPYFSDSQLADINQLAEFLALDQTGGATPNQMARSEPQLLILLGNAILPVAERAFTVLSRGAVEKILIAGGIGHSTDLLNQAVKGHANYHVIATEGRSEAAILLDIASTNCGDNAVQARRVLEQAGEPAARIILTQDPLMQRRTDASFRKVWQDRPEVQFINWPTFTPQIEQRGDGLAYRGETDASLWSWPRFASLLLGEIPRLRNTVQGYGPLGKGFIAAVDIPPEIEAAYARISPLLSTDHGDRSF